MSAAHTSAPWLRIDTPDYAEIHAAFRPSSSAVALVANPDDANLITASPDMLEALYLVEAFLYATAPESNELQIVRAAIAKALGRTPNEIGEEG